MGIVTIIAIMTVFQSFGIASGIKLQGSSPGVASEVLSMSIINVEAVKTSFLRRLCRVRDNSSHNGPSCCSCNKSSR